MNDNVKFYVFEKAAAARGEGGRRQPLSRNSPGELLRYNLHRATLLYAVCGYFLSVATVMAEIYPFGLAFFAALCAADKRRMIVQFWPVLAGYLLFSPAPPVYGTILLLLALFFTVYPATGKKPRFIVPVIVFAVTLVVRGLFLIFAGISDLLLLIIFSEAILAAALSFVFLMALQAVRRSPTADKLRREEILCIFLLLVSLILGMQSVALYGVSLAEVAMRFLILAAALLGGSGGGAAVGAICGVIPSLAAPVSPSAIGILAFSGLLAGVFQRFGRLGVAIGFILGNLLLSFYLLDVSLLLYAVIATLVAAFLLILMPKGLLFRLRELFVPVFATAPRGVQRQRYDDYVAARLNEVGDKLQSLRTVLKTMDREKIPREEKNIQSILRHLSGKVCVECSLKDMCWKSDFYRTYHDVMVMFAAVEAGGVVCARDVPKSFQKRCSHTKEMVATINCLSDMYRKNEYWQRQIAGSRVLALGQLENTVHLLTGIGDNLDIFRDFRELMNGRLAPALRSKGLPVEQVIVRDVGEKNFDLDLRVRRCKGDGGCGLVIANTVRELAGKDYHPAELRCGDGKKGKPCHCRFFLAGTGDVLSAALQLPKAGSEICGDSKDDFLLASARRAFVLSDGMGSGESARREADLTVALVRDVLQCGFDERFAATVVNYLLLMKQEEEVYATVDLCLLDLFRGEAEFIKLGASPSYLCTKSGVTVIAGNSLPLGSGGEVTTFREKVSRGDVLVMVSDGVLHTAAGEDEMEVWLMKTLEDSRREEPRIIAERIISGAVAFSGGKPQDDLTVVAALIR